MEAGLITSSYEFSKYDSVMMFTAFAWSSLSEAPDKQVGAVLAYSNRVISCGYNGTGSGDAHVYHDASGKTLDTVIHAEANIINHCAKHGVKTKGCTIYTTLSPCLRCAVTIVSAGISKLFYCQEYKCADGLNYLIDHGIDVIRMDENDFI